MAQAAMIDMQDQSQPQQGARHSVLVEFASTDQLLAAANRCRDAGLKYWDWYSPFPVHGIDAAMGIVPTRLPWMVFLFGLAGAMAGIILQLWTNALYFAGLPAWLQGYEYIISGKPLLSIPAYIPVMFETTILFSAFSTGLGMLAINGLPRLYHPLFSSSRFKRVTQDRFFVAIALGDPRLPGAGGEDFVRSLGGTIEYINVLPQQKLPGWVTTVIVALIGLALIPWVTGFRVRNTIGEYGKVRLHQDMGSQPKIKEQSSFSLFFDGRGERPLVPGTIARGELKLDTALHTGKVNGKPIEYFPVIVNEELLKLGQKKFNVNCAVCHGFEGKGNGTVYLRTQDRQLPWGALPANLLDPKYREGTIDPGTGTLATSSTTGHLYDVVNNGWNNMWGYGHKLNATERWAVVAYIRALQEAHPLPDAVAAPSAAPVNP